jgi:hypothetical protein
MDKLYVTGRGQLDGGEQDRFRRTQTDADAAEVVAAHLKAAPQTPGRDWRDTCLDDEDASAAKRSGEWRPVPGCTCRYTVCVIVALACGHDTAIATARGAGDQSGAGHRGGAASDDERSFRMIPMPGGCIMVSTPRSRSW